PRSARLALLPGILKDESYGDGHGRGCRLAVQYCRAIFPFLDSLERLINKQRMPVDDMNVHDIPANVDRPFQDHSALDSRVSSQSWICGQRLLDQYGRFKTATDDGWWFDIWFSRRRLRRREHGLGKHERSDCARSCQR